MFLEVSGDSFARSRLFPADVLLMTPGLQLISQELSAPSRMSFYLFLVLHPVPHPLLGYHLVSLHFRISPFRG